MLAQNPWVLLVGLSAAFVGSAFLALYSLGSVGYVQQQKEPETIPDEPIVLEELTNTPSETSNPTPLWMIAAIALCCGSGCLIILRLVNHRGQRPKRQQKINHNQAQLRQSRQHQKPQPPKNPRVFVPSSSLSPQTKPLMTVLTPEQRYRLDKSQESLADLMDLRKQSSLSGMLGKY